MLGRSLVTKEDHYFVRYSESVDGLLPAASVKLNGVIVGKITEISVDTSDVQKIIVHFAVKHGTPIKQDMEANLAGGLNITGLKNIEITGGSNHSPNVPLGGELKAGISQITKITGQAEAIAMKVEKLLNNLITFTNDKNQSSISDLLQNVSSLSGSLDTMLNQNSQLMSGMIQHADKAIIRFEETAANATGLIQDFRKEKPGKKLSRTLDDLNKTVDKLNGRIEKMEVEKTLTKFQDAAESFSSAAGIMENTLAVINEDLGNIMNKINSSADNFEDFSRIIKENPSLLLRTGDKQERGQ